MSQRNRMGLAPLAVIAGGAALTACVCSLTVAGVVLRANHRTTAPIWQVVLAGGPMALVLAAASAWVAARFARSLRLLRAEAVRRLHDPSAPVGEGTAAQIPQWSGAELAGEDCVDGLPPEGSRGEQHLAPSLGGDVA